MLILAFRPRGAADSARRSASWLVNSHSPPPAVALRWIAYRVSIGRGEGSSGLEFDTAVR